jgi:hypothetical protein
MPILGLALVFAVLFIATYVGLAVRHYRRMSGPRLVHCRAARTAATIELDAFRSALLLAPAHETPVRRCSQWPARKGCAQWCCDDLEYAPAGGRFEQTLASWYRGKRCADCGQPIPPVRSGRLRPSLRGPDGSLLEWAQIEPEQLFAVLETHRPVCVGCDVSDVLRRHLTIDRPAGATRTLG